MAIKKILSLAATVLVFGSFTQSPKTSTTNTYQNDVTLATTHYKPSLYSTADYNASAPETNRDVFYINTRSCTVTPKAKSFEFVFQSVQVKTYNSSSKSFFVAIDDESYTGDPNDYEKPAEGQEAPHFNGYIYHVEGGNSGDVYIPNTFKYGSKFVVDIKYIASGCADGNEGDFDGIDNIYLPSALETIYADAFTHVPSTVTFKCQGSSANSGWEVGWTDSTNIEYGVEIKSSNLTAAFTAGGEKSFGDAANYVIGCVNKPLILTYDILKNGSVDRTNSYTFDIADDVNGFDAVGGLFAQTSLTKLIDIVLAKDENIDFESFVFHNIYSAKLSDDGKSIARENGLPVLETEYKTTSEKRFSEEINIDSIMEYGFKRVSTFAGYTNVSMNVNIVSPSAYPTLKPTVYNNYLPEISSGKYRVRYAFYSMSSASYQITYRSNSGELVTKNLKVVTPLSAFEISKQTNNQISFLVKNKDVGDDFTADKLVSFDVVGAYVNVHLWDTVNNNKLGRSDFSKRFGNIEVLGENDTVEVLNLGGFIAVFYSLYLVCFAALAVVLYFYLKNKYKNDEFRRMKTKPYIKKAILGFIGSLVVITAVMFIIFRSTVFKNSVATFNPTDIFVVIASLVGLVIIGYFIRFLVLSIKAEKQRRVAIKLRLDEDSDDDGTK